MWDDLLASHLLEETTVHLDQIQEAEAVRDRQRTSLGDALIELGYCSENQIAVAVAHVCSLPYVDLDSIVIEPSILELIPESIARENDLLPIAERQNAEGENTLVLATCDPWRAWQNDTIRFVLNREIELVVAGSQSIRQAINQYYRQSEGESLDSLTQEMTQTQIDFEYVSLSAEAEDESEPRSPAARIVDLIIGEALQASASDIHLEPFADRVQVRYRIDGRCRLRSNLPRRIHSNVISRIMVLAKMDITNRRAPSDGRIRTQIGDRRTDVRVSIVPSQHGLACVMRLLDRDSIHVSIGQLGMNDDDCKRFMSLTKRPNGILLVTGPTGSGKTTTLYSVLKSLNTPSRKIITAEDPVEYNLPGVNQVEVDRGRGLDFASIVRSMLRQAPNVILVGEIRDAETASMAIQASQTGHLVLSTLHTTDAPSAIVRLEELGVPRYKISSSVMGILAQRLVRVVCSRCRIRARPSPRLLESTQLSFQQQAEADFVVGKGCPHCRRTGFRGRVGIYELMVIDSDMRRLMDEGASTAELRATAVRAGMTTLFQDGIHKATEGLTTIEEVHRVAAPEAVMA